MRAVHTLSGVILSLAISMPVARAETIYVSDIQGFVGAFDTTTMTGIALGNLPAQGYTINQIIGITHDPMSDRILLLARHNNDVYSMDPVTGVAVVIFNPPSTFQGGAALNNVLYGINESSQTLEAYSLPSGTPIPLAGGGWGDHSHGLGVDPVAGQLYLGGANAVYTISTTGTVGPAVVTSGLGQEDVEFFNGDFLAVQCGNEVMLIDGVTSAAAPYISAAQITAMGITGCLTGVAVRQNTAEAFVRVVDTLPTAVVAGQTGIVVTVDVESGAMNPLDVTAVALTFTDATMADVTGEYTVTPDPVNPTVIAAAATETFSFTVDVSAGATLGPIILDGTFDGMEQGTGIVVTDPDSDVTDTWDVLACIAPTCGDCSGDLLVTIIDALLAAQHSAGLIMLTGIDFSNCNVIGTLEPAPGASVDILDALTLAQEAAGLPVMLVCC